MRSVFEIIHNKYDNILYFWTLQSVKNFIKINVLPNGTLSPTRIDLPRTVKSMPPKNPKKTPKTLSRVIFSDKKNDDKIIKSDENSAPMQTTDNMVWCKSLPDATQLTNL